MVLKAWSAGAAAPLRGSDAAPRSAEVEEMVFFDDAEPAAAPISTRKLLVVDDEPDIHKITELALGDLVYGGHRLEFLSARSAAEARAVMGEHPDIVLVLLDVVMETDQAGLEFIHHVRKELGNKKVRIILRTGQPGVAPERQVILEYDIHDYKAKSELTAQKLFTCVIGALRTYDDLEEMERISIAKAQAEAALAQSRKMETVGRLTGGVAHDFNNLLTVILGRAERMRGVAHREVPALVRDADAVAYAADRAAGLTHRLLTFSRQQPLRASVVDLNALVSGMADLLQQTVRESIELRFELAPDAWLTSVDANQLENAILNLAVNARDAMPKGGILTVATANEQVEGECGPGFYATVHVSDSGTGMPPEVIARAFDPFFTTKPEGKGTGLGLSMVQALAKEAGGFVRIGSEPGQGSTVAILLPRLQEAVAPAAPARDASETLPRARAEGEAVLVVEDEDSVRSFSIEGLGRLGYDVLEARDFAEALRHLEDRREIALLLTDVGLPGGRNGCALANEARRLRPTLRVLFTSGYAPDVLASQDGLDPACDLLPKPFTDAKLAHKVREMLDRPQENSGAPHAAH